MHIVLLKKHVGCKTNQTLFLQQDMIVKTTPVQIYLMEDIVLNLNRKTFVIRLHGHFTLTPLVPRLISLVRMKNGHKGHVKEKRTAHGNQTTAPQ